jgi:hypothetical protein
MNEQKPQNLKWSWLALGIIGFFVIIVAAVNQTPTQPVSEPTPSTTMQLLPPSAPPTEIPVSQNIGPKWDYASLTPEIFNRIIQKIRSAPNSEIKSTKTSEQASVTFYYSFVAHDPCEPLLKDFLVLEIETTTYVDENGQKYPNGPITDYYLMRDTDHDTYPEDYYTPEEPIPDAVLCDPRIASLPFTEDTPHASEILSLWEIGMNYFAANLLN